MRRPSQRSIDLYNALVDKQNKVRKQLRRLHKGAEETLGAGRLPALIVPKASHKIRKSYFEGLSSAELHKRLKAFWDKYQVKKALFGKGLTSYIARVVKEGYLELWRDQIERNFGESPEAFYGHTFSADQIKNSDGGEFMQVYNALFRQSPESFLALIYTGRMIAFKYIYQEMQMTKNNTGYSWLEQQKENLRQIGKVKFKNPEEWLKFMRSPKELNKLLDEAGSKKNSYKHKASTIREAEARYEEDEE